MAPNDRIIFTQYVANAKGEYLFEPAARMWPTSFTLVKYTQNPI